MRGNAQQVELTLRPKDSPKGVENDEGAQLIPDIGLWFGFGCKRALGGANPKARRAAKGSGEGEGCNSGLVGSNGVASGLWPVSKLVVEIMDSLKRVEDGE